MRSVWATYTGTNPGVSYPTIRIYLYMDYFNSFYFLIWMFYSGPLGLSNSGICQKTGLPACGSTEAGQNGPNLKLPGRSMLWKKRCLCLFPLIYSVWSFAVSDFCNCYPCCGIFVHFLLISCLLYCLWFEILDLFSSRFDMQSTEVHQIHRDGVLFPKQRLTRLHGSQKMGTDVSQLLKLIPGNGFFFRCTLIR